MKPIRHDSWIARAMSFLPDSMYLAIRHRYTRGRWPSLSNPTHFNEFILRNLLTRDEAELRTLISDKFAVRDNIREIVGAKHLTDLYATWDGTSAFPLDSLPNAFVAKPNHASGPVKLVRDKSELDPVEFEELCREWLAIDHAALTREYVYARFPPRIVFEELLAEPNSDDIPNDYMFFVIKGVVRLISVTSNEHYLDQGFFFDPDWNQLPISRQEAPRGAPPAKPPNFEKMMVLAVKLSQGLNFLRVDFYDLGDRLIVGELTNFPEGANQHFDTETDRFYGQFFQ
jgi:hypothetical protein